MSSVAQPVMRLAVEADVAAGSHHAAQRAQHRRLAGAIGPQQGAHLPLVEIEPDPEQRLLLAVERLEAVRPRASSGRFPAGSAI